MSDSPPADVQVAVVIGEQFVEKRVCRAAHTPDGRLGVIYRGLVHPLLQGDRIDLAGPAYVPDTYVVTPASSGSARFDFVWGDRSGYLLVEGSVADREAAASALRAAGADVLRAGRYLGDPIEGLSPDWFVRFENFGQAPDGLERAVSETLASQLRMRVVSDYGELRLHLIAIELAEARARAAMLQAENARLRVERAEAMAARDIADLNAAKRVDAERAQLLAALADEARARETAEALARDSRTTPAAASPVPRNLQREIGTVVEILLPHVHLLRDSLLVAAVEYRDRKSLYRALAQLDLSEGRPPNTWKKLADLKYWERHVSDGASDVGRVYAWLDTSARVFRVLVSNKSEQTRDIAWLRQRGSSVG